MPAVVPPTIAALPIPPDPNDRATFNPRAYPWSLAQAQLAQDVAAVSSNVYNNALEAKAQADNAAARRDEAQAAAASATLSANATQWVSDAYYASGVITWSPSNFQTYRRRAAGSGTTDPVNDYANWEPIARDAVGALVSIAGNTTAQRFQTYSLSSAAIVLTLPAVAYVGDWIGIIPPLEQTNNAQKVARNGHLIIGLAEDMDIDVRQPFRLAYISPGSGWVMAA